jgi:RNA polymerase sigma factor (sigma-70 family)
MPARRRLTEDERDLAGSVWDAYRPFVESVARRHLADRLDEVPDVVQNVGLRLCRHLNGFRGAGGLRTWIFRVTVHETRTLRRGASRHGRILEALTLEPAPAPAPNPHEHLERTLTVQTVRDALNSLPPLQRAILRHDLDGSGVNTSESGIRSLRYRARKQLRSLIDRNPHGGR